MNKRSLIIVLVVAVLLIAGLLVRGRHNAAQAASPPPLATVNPDTISKLPAFASADKQVADKWQSMTKQLQAEQKSKHLSAKDMASRTQQMQKSIDALRVSLLRPLNQRVYAAMGKVAGDKHLEAIVDSRIVLTGLPDVTNDVVAAFNANQGSTNSAPDSSTIGYVDQSKIRGLSAFRNAESQLVTYYTQLSGKLKSVPDSQKPHYESKMASQLQQKRQQLYSPLEAKVHTALSSVEQQSGVSLILDRTMILWGGKDLTNSVVSRLNQAGLAQR